jgi:hypothetical protein
MNFWCKLYKLICKYSQLNEVMRLDSANPQKINDKMIEKRV